MSYDAYRDQLKRRPQIFDDMWQDFKVGQRGARAKKDMATVRDWNAKHPIGTLVEVTRDDGVIEETLTASAAWLMGGHTAVIKLLGISGGYSLSRVRAIQR